MQMPGRTITGTSQYCYGFNGKELDPSMDGNNYDYWFRIYNPQVGGFYLLILCKKNTLCLLLINLLVILQSLQLILMERKQDYIKMVQLELQGPHCQIILTIRKDGTGGGPLWELGQA